MEAIIVNREGTAVLTVLILSLVTLAIVCITPVRAQDQSGFTINGDGSISPSTALVNQTGNYYALQSDVKGDIVVQRSNIVLDGNGHTVTGLIRVGSLPYTPTAGRSVISNVTVENFMVTGSYFGISLWQSSNTTIVNNTITGTGNGILALDEPTAAIDVEGGFSNAIVENNLYNNYDGISFLETVRNAIVGNNIADSNNPINVTYYANGGWTHGYIPSCGLVFSGSSNNTIYHNNFIDNEYQASVEPAASQSSENIWDDGSVSGGNYWSDYLTKYPNVTVIDSSGIGNSQYVIGAQDRDRYPLMAPFVMPKISLMAPISMEYNESTVSLAFTSNAVLNWTGYSLDGLQNVTIDGNATVPGLSSGTHSIIVYANDTLGDMAASQPINFTIAAQEEQFPIIPVAAALGASIVVVCAVLLMHFKKRKRLDVETARQLACAGRNEKLQR